MVHPSVVYTPICLLYWNDGIILGLRVAGDSIVRNDAKKGRGEGRNDFRKKKGRLEVLEMWTMPHSPLQWSVDAQAALAH